jgi:SAM-dependent methyltransferase
MGDRPSPEARAAGAPAARNVDPLTVAGFGDEWERFDQRAVESRELDELFSQYFAAFDWSRLSEKAEGFDLGCGSGRWAARVAPRVGRLHCIDASAKALDVARRTLAAHANCVFHHASVDELPLADATMDFGYSVGVLHHVPDTGAALRDCVRKLKPGGQFLVYLYYAMDNRPLWYRGLWRLSDALRVSLARLPFAIRYGVSQAVAFLVYWPLARLAALAERLGLPTSNVPLAFYRHRSLYTMRTDALDRLGTRLERRFTRSEVRALMEDAGLEAVVISDGPPHWCAVGRRTR